MPGPSSLRSLLFAGLPARVHATRVETRAERLARGQPVEHELASQHGYRALGGLTHMLSLADGMTRAEMVCSRTQVVGRGSLN